MTSSDKGKTGVFKEPGQGAIVVLWQGRKICQYDSMEAFVDSHIAGIDALERKQEDLLAESYRDNI